MNITTIEYAAFFEKFGKHMGEKAPCPDHWASFLARLQECLPAPARSSSPPSWSADDMLKFFVPLRKAISEDLKSGNRVSFWNVAKIGKDEMRNSYVLRWLLDCREEHGQEDLFLTSLLDWISEELKKPEFFPSCCDLKNCGYWTRVEAQPLGEKESRVDIEVGGPFVLFIEVKVNSGENGGQIKRYVDIARKKAGNKKWGVVYLTRNGKPPADPSLKEWVVPISWSQLASLYRKIAKTKLAKDSLTRYLVEEFCTHIKKL